MLNYTQTRCCSYFNLNCNHEYPAQRELSHEQDRAESSTAGSPSLGFLLPAGQLVLRNSFERRQHEPSILLSLPAVIRQRIYQECKFYQFDKLDMKVTEGHNYLDTKSEPRDPLLSVGRTVRHEIEATLCSPGIVDLVFDGRVPRGGMNYLQGLKYFKPHNAGARPRLHLALDFRPCVYGYHCQHQYGLEQSPPLPLECRSRYNVELFYAWRSAIQHIASCINPGTLELAVYCNVFSPEAIRLCLEVLSCMPRLSECFIMFLPGARGAMLEYAQTMAAELTGRLGGRFTFPHFFDLPKEIQLAILEYTDLVTPIRDVAHRSRGDICPGLYQSLHSARSCSRICRLNRWANAKCMCWAPPTPFFLASKKMQSLAYEIFFTKNRFVFSQYQIGGSWDWALFSSILAYMSRMARQDTLHWLRSLRILFPAYPGSYSLEPNWPEYTSWDEWANMLDDLKVYLDLPALEITLYISIMGLSYVPMQLGETTVDFIRRQQEHCLLGLSKLRGLRAFHVHLIPNHPFENQFDLHYILQTHLPLVESETQKRTARSEELRMERVVLGEDYTGGQRKIRGFRWPQCFDNDFHCTHCQCPS